MALKKSELYSSLWASCDELRGGMDASQYKDYVLVLLFIKYVSDKYAGIRYAPVTIPEGSSFQDMVALKGKSDIGDQINKKIIAPLAKANNLSDFPDFNEASKLGSGKEMVDRLTNLIGIFENPALDFSKNRADGDDILGDAYEYSSASYSMYLLCKDIRNKPLPTLVKVLTKRLAEDNVTLEEAVDKGRHGLDEFNLNQWSRKYILHILARFSSLAEELGGRSDQFDAYVDRTKKNPFDIEHIWSGKFSTHKKDFESENEFDDWRNHIGSLLLLPADINRSLQDKGFAHKRAKYASENLYAASLHEPAYSHQPKFKAAIKREGLAFKAYETFGKNEQLERRELVKQLAKLIWSPDHLQEIADE